MWNVFIIEIKFVTSTNLKISLHIAYSSVLAGAHKNIFESCDTHESVSLNPITFYLYIIMYASNENSWFKRAINQWSLYLSRIQIIP